MITSLTNVICLDGVGKKYPLLTDFWALKEISLEVSSGEILGIIGRNGAGKTTLLNILAGTLSSTEGECSIQGKVLGLFNLGVGFGYCGKGVAERAKGMGADVVILEIDFLVVHFCVPMVVHFYFLIDTI